jgi:hypothetical protein
MLLKSCSECLGSSCACGTYWKDWNIEAISKFINSILSFYSEKKRKEILSRIKYE